jgi:hypothetical protein
VSIGLAALGARMLGGEMGSLLQTIILSSSILYELIGPACAKLALYLSKSYGVEQEEKVEPPPTEVETLQEKLLQIQNEIEKKQYVRTEEEAAFLDAAEEEDDSFSDYNKRKFKNRR